jgi:small subunit ribosomal protein S5
MVRVPTVGTTIPHPVEARYGGAVVMLRPATPGTGVIAGGAVRAVVEVAGVKDILTKSKGSNNMLNVARATLKGLEMLNDYYDLAQAREKDPGEIAPFWLRESRESE